jgi:succinate dehydrogenase/fumarate reductase-like Fe-S protein
MNKVFCVSCGFKILYEVTKPKFCSSCGESVGGVSAASKKEEVEETSELDIDIEKLKKDIVVEKSDGATTLKSLWSTAAAPSNDDIEARPPSNDPEGQALLDQIIEDCSSSRTRDINE